MNIYIVFSFVIVAVILVLLYPLLTDREIPAQKKKQFSLIAAIIFFTASLFLYHQFGSPGILPLLAAREQKMAGLKEQITKASDQIKQDPKNLRAWLVLGDSFMETGQFAAASNAYKQAVLVSEGNPAIIMAYARAMIAQNDGTISADAKKSLDMVLLLQPSNEECRYYQALYKLQSGNTKQAMQEMKELYHSLPDDSPLKGMINRQIGRK